MDLKIKINGEFTNEELQEKLKEFDKPEWEIKTKNGYVELFKDGEFEYLLLYGDKGNPTKGFSTISKDIALAMGDLMETKDVLDNEELGYYIGFDSAEKCGSCSSSYDYTSDKHFKTEETADLAAKLLNESKDMRDGIKRMSE